MKYIPNILILAGAVITFQSFTLSNWEVSEIMQAVVDLEPMESVWEKGGEGRMEPSYLVAHDHFPEVPQFTIHGKKVAVISEEAAADLSEDTPYIEVVDFKVKKGKKARLKFTYNGIDVKAVMVRQEGAWKHRRLSITGKGINHKSLDWTF